LRAAGRPPAVCLGGVRTGAQAPRNRLV